MKVTAADTILRSAHAAARCRRAMDVLLHAAPWLCVSVALAWRMDWQPWALLLPALTIAATAWLAWRAAHTIDAAWLARRLDAQRIDMDDSSSLLLSPGAAGNPLQRLQRARLRQRLESGAAPDLRPAWHARTALASLLAALVVLCCILLWPASVNTVPGEATAIRPGVPQAIATPRLIRQRIEIRPPAYTGLPERTQTALDAKAPEGATLRWSLRFAPIPASVELVFLDGERMALQRDGDDNWIASRRLQQSALYRIVPSTAQPAPQPDLHRIDIVSDQPPQLRTLQPERNLTLRADGQRTWTLVFEAEDDYGLAAQARLWITRTLGGGENITAQTRTIAINGRAIAGRGDATHKRYTHTFDLDTLGMGAGNDLIAQLEVIDNRAPQPQRTRSPSHILRWPQPPVVDTVSLAGMVQKTMPAYFRSQRQIIIDAEALQARKPELDVDSFVQQSDAIGVDQRALRLRYGQFLGEASEGAPIMPTNDAELNEPDARGASVPGTATQSRDDHDHDGDDGHDHADDTGGSAASPDTFGAADGIVAEYGHMHDIAGAATLFDPDTRELLRDALGEMWQSELNLRQGKPDTALPFARRALELIKQAQEATRIYLPRTGSQPPAIDFGRRLDGDRDGIADRRDLLSESTPPDPLPAAAWRALQDAPGEQRTAEFDHDALERWARANSARTDDPLSLYIAIDAARTDPACADCRQRLRRALWPLLPKPPAATDARPRADAAGQAYLEALDRDSEQ